MLKNPILLAVFTGFIFVIFELTIPSILYKFLENISYKNYQHLKKDNSFMIKFVKH